MKLEFWSFQDSKQLNIHFLYFEKLTFGMSVLVLMWSPLPVVWSSLMSRPSISSLE